MPEILAPPIVLYNKFQPGAYGSKTTKKQTHPQFTNQLTHIALFPEAPGCSLSLEIRQITMIAVNGILDSVQLNLAFSHGLVAGVHTEVSSKKRGCVSIGKLSRIQTLPKHTLHILKKEVATFGCFQK